MTVTWLKALAWRLSRHYLDPIGTASAPAVVGRLGAVPAQFDDAAELAIRVRQQHSEPGEIAQVFTDGTLIKSFAFRGATHLMTPEDAAAYLALRCASRMWELPSWQEYYRVTPADWPALLDAVREALADGPLTLAELGAAVTKKRRFRHLGFAFDAGGSNLIKPICWHGAMSFGPRRDGETTFASLDDNPHWTGLLDLDAAGMRAVEAFYRSYGPATADQVQRWLGSGLSAGRKRINSWIAALDGRLAEVRIGGESAFLLADDLDDLQAARASKAVRLLPGYDPWVVGPGTDDTRVVPSELREQVSRKANLVLRGGVVSGTWTVADDRITVAWSPGAGRRPTQALAAESARVEALLGSAQRPIATD